MFRKINNVFRPNHHGHRGRDGASGDGLDYHSACTVRLVRSTSMMVVGERSRAAASSTLKRSKSTVSIESTLCYRHRQEDMVWLYSQNRNCLEYLEALVALRRRYTKIVSDCKSSDAKKMPAPPPSKEGQVRPLNLSQNRQRDVLPFCFKCRHRDTPPLPSQTRRTLCGILMRSSPAVTARLCANLTRMMATQTWTS